MAARHKINPNQLKLLMSPAEITQHYAPLEGDREEVYDDPDDMYGRTESDPEFWSRKYGEASMSPEDYHYYRGGTDAVRTRSFNVEKVMERSSYPQPANTSNLSTSQEASWEGHEQSYLDRKYTEHYAAEHARFSGSSLAESVIQQGVQRPVHLGSQFGDEGLPEIVGGHHRIAVAMQHRPHDLIPVLHHESLLHAQHHGQEAYKYT